jgi:hypothetical protein
MDNPLRAVAKPTTLSSLEFDDSMAPRNYMEKIKSGSRGRFILAAIFQHINPLRHNAEEPGVAAGAPALRRIT